MTISDFFERHYKPLRLLGKSPRTVSLFRYSIRLFEATLGRPAELEDLTDEVVADHLQKLINEGRRPAGVNKERRQLLALWRAAARKRLVQDFPEIGVIPEPERLPEAWSTQELDRILIACRMIGRRKTYFGVPASAWWFAIHLVLWDSGERISALLAIEWGDLRDGWLTVRAEVRKGRRKPMAYRLRPETLEALEKLRSTGQSKIFAWPYSATYIYRAYRELLDAAGVDSGHRSKFHRMRRSVASHVAAAGGNPSLALGHANPATTARYIDPRIAKPIQASDLLPSLIGDLSHD